MKILIFGLSGSGKTPLAKPFAELMNAVHINADDIRNEYEDWDFSIKGRLRQSLRMRHLADGVVMAGKIAVIDFICPTAVARDWVNADYTIWMDTIKESQHKDTDIIFQKPDISSVNYHVNQWFNDTHQQLVKVVSNFMLRKEGKPTEKL